MSPVTHFLTGWVLANSAPLGTRDRALVTLAGVVPDIDGLGIVADVLTRHSLHPTDWFASYHHSLHTLLFGLVVMAVLVQFAARRMATAGLVLVSFHLHLLEDVLGSRALTAINGRSLT